MFTCVQLQLAVPCRRRPRAYLASVAGLLPSAALSTGSSSMLSDCMAALTLKLASCAGAILEYLHTRQGLRLRVWR